MYQRFLHLKRLYPPALLRSCLRQRRPNFMFNITANADRYAWWATVVCLADYGIYTSIDSKKACYERDLTSTIKGDVDSANTDFEDDNV